jgi:hypothetical protein
VGTQAPPGEEPSCFIIAFSVTMVGNFNLVSEFSAINDVAAATIVEQSRVRPLELWQATRKVRLWS